MLILGKVLSFLLGPALVPALIVSLLAMGGHFLASQKARIASEATRKCEADVEIASLQQQVASANAVIAATQKQLDATDLLYSEIRNANEELQRQFTAARETAAAERAAAPAADPWCVSPSVRELVRPVPGPVRGTDGGEAGSNGSGKRRPAPAAK